MSSKTRILTLSPEKSYVVNDQILLAYDVRRDVGVAAIADHKNVRLTCCLSALKVVTKWFSIVDSIIENPVKHIKRSKRDANVNGS